MVKIFKSPNPFKKTANTPIIQEKEYYPTWSEFASQKYEQVIRDLGVSGSYTVPANKIFFLTNIQGTLRNSGAGSGALNLEISSFNLELFVLTCSNAGQSSGSLNFVMPIKVNPNTTLTATSSNASGNLTIYGFLVPFSP